MNTGAARLRVHEFLAEYSSFALEPKPPLACRWPPEKIPDDDVELSSNSEARVDLAHAYLPWVDVQRLDLSAADFHEAHLSGANFSGAILVGTIFSKANLLGALLGGATTEGVHWDGALLMGATSPSGSYNHAGWTTQHALRPASWRERPWSQEDLRTLSKALDDGEKFSLVWAVARLDSPIGFGQWRLPLRTLGEQLRIDKVSAKYSRSIERLTRMVARREFPIDLLVRLFCRLRSEQVTDDVVRRLAQDAWSRTKSI